VKKLVVFGLIFLFCSVLFPVPAKAEAQAVPTISLEEGNVVLPNSDVELLAVGKDTFYTVVNSRDKYWWLFSSKNQGRTWQKVGQGLPEEEKFILLEAQPGNPDVVALATTTGVYLSSDGGIHFSYLGSPYGLTERREEITSLTLAGGSSILLGVRHPSTGKFAQEGVYLWEGKSWEAQSGQGVWQKDVNAVAFLEGYILALTSDNTGTFLNIAYPGQRTFWGIKWNELPGWPIEVSQVAGESPKEGELLNARLAFSQFEWEEGKIYVIFNTLQKVKDDVYCLKFREQLKPEGARRLEISKVYPIISLDSIVYTGTVDSGTLTVGVTTEERGQRRAMVYYLDTAGERYSPPDWQRKWGVPDTQNCRVAIVNSTIFAAISGKGSSFVRSEPKPEQRDVLISISLIDASGIGLLAPSPNFLQDKTIYLTCGKNVLKIILGEDYKLVEAQRLLYFAQPVTFLKIDPQPQNLFVFVIGKTKLWLTESVSVFWVTENFGLSWSFRWVGREVDIVDGKAMTDKLVYVAGNDNMIYRSENAGLGWQRLSPGVRFIRKVEAGPSGKILVAGGVKTTDNIFDAVSLIGERSPVTLPLPLSATYLELLYSSKENLIYCGVNKVLYTNVSSLDGEWQKITEFSWPIKRLFVAPQGLYVSVFSGAETRFYFIPVPLKDSQPVGVREPKGEWLGYKLVELAEKRNLVILWDYSKILIWTHQIPEKKPATFAASNLTIIPAEVETGKAAVISALITNSGDIAVKFKVALNLNNAVISTKAVTLAAGASEKVAFTVTRNEAGTYTVEVSGLTGILKVKSPPSPAPTQTPTQTPSPTPTPTPVKPKPKEVSPAPVVPPSTARETGFPEGAVVPILAFFGGMAWIVVKLVRYARNKLRP